MACCDHDDASHNAELVNTIDLANVTCLNEVASGSARALLRPHCARASRAAWVDSHGDDADLLIAIPFTSAVRLRALALAAGAPPACPARARLFVNTPGLDFETASSATPAQELLIAGPDEAGDAWHVLRGAKFNNISSLQVLLTGNAGARDGDAPAAVRLFYLGLRAEVTGHKGGIVHATYEVVPQATRTRDAAGGGVAFGM